MNTRKGVIVNRSLLILVAFLLLPPLGFLIPGPSFSAQEPPSAASGNVENGKAIYHRTCFTCHGDKAQGNVAFNAPKLAGQEDWYMIRQLENFASGARGSDPRDLFGAQMRPMAMTLVGPTDIVDVVAYIRSLPQ